ncbi:MAG: class I SAM-dependent methyltransferase [Candidatus Aminicenantales bacterium]
MFFLAKLPFSACEVRDYEKRRYRGLDQRLVHRREVRILEKIMKLIEDLEKETTVVTVRGQNSTPYRIIRRWALDAPCGYGRFSGLLLRRGYRLVSADLSLAMVERACSRQNNYTFPIGIVCNMVGGLPFKPEVFPLILTIRLFHHLHESGERQKVLQELAYVASGWIILSYYQSNPLHRLQRRLRRLLKKTRTRIRMITRREFEQEVRAAGLNIVRTFPLFKGIHGHHIALLKPILGSDHANIKKINELDNF